ncbi:MAG TPA: ABC transporter substrate binding protein [Desulfobaccales bacterium]
MTMTNCFISRDENRKPETGNRKPLIIILLLALLVQGGCGPGSPGPVVVFCSPDSPRLQQAIDGLKASLGQEPVQVVCVPEFGADAGERLRQVRRQRPRLLVALGTPALRQVAPLEKHTPVVFALVGNPYFTGAAYFPDHPEDHQENVTGLATPPPLTAALKQGAGLLGGGPWGLLYDPNDGVAVELARRFGQEAPAHGIRPLTEASAAAAGDGPGLERLLAQGARVIYLPPAPSAARYAPRLLEAGRRQKVMVVSGYPEGDHNGAVLWLAVDYRRLGEEAGALARRVLSGEAPKNIPIVESAPLQVQVDESLLRRWSGYPPPTKSNLIR